MLSLIFICYRRPKLLRNSLESVNRQTLRPDEIILMEDGDDGGETAAIAKEFGAKHIQRPRPDFPLFGNLPAVRNMAIKSASGDYICIQDSEIRYQTDTALEEMMKSATSLDGISQPLVLNLDEDGSVNKIYGWYSKEAAYFGGGPFLGKKDYFLKIGGWEEQFQGYGFDDHFFLLCLRKNNILYFHANAIAEHQWHIRVPHEITGFANRSLIFLYEQEIEQGIRPAVANYGPPVTQAFTEETFFEYIREIGYELDRRTRHANIPWRASYCNWHNTQEGKYWSDIIHPTFDIIGVCRNQKDEPDTKDHIAAYLYADATWAIAQAKMIEYDSDARWNSHKDRLIGIHKAWATAALQKAKKILCET